MSNDDDVFFEPSDGETLPTENSTKVQENQWIEELRLAVDRGCDLGSIRSIGKCRPLTDDLRLAVWKICLNIDESHFITEYTDSDVFDLPEQNFIREEVLRLVCGSSSSKDDLLVSKMSDVEAIVTFYSKKYNEIYEKSNGWLDLLKPLINLPYKNRSTLYALFATIRQRYVPRTCSSDGIGYHLFRLLLLYHDPELCTFFDSKKLTADLYVKNWIQSLYSGSCSTEVVLQLWDGYFQHADQFFMFFLALVLLMFAKEQVLTMADKDKTEIIEVLSKAPCNLSTEDLTDFCSLANHYASNTPQSFRKDFYSSLFYENTASTRETTEKVHQALCLPVSVGEILQANQLGGSAGVRYFLVDCRSADQYNSKHLSTAFHLDVNLLLKDPKEFSEMVDALLTTQKNAIETGSTAGGEHLCFLGSGHEDEDKYLQMVIAHFLQRNTKYVSIANGGYEILAEAIEDPSMITQPRPQPKPKTTPVHKSFDAAAISATIKQNIVEKLPVINNQTVSLFNMISNTVKTKSMEVKDKVKDYLVQNAYTAETPNPTTKHVSKQDKVDKLYRQHNQKSVFSLDGDDDESTVISSEVQSQKLVDIESWFLRSDMLYKYECEHIDENNRHHPSLLLVSSTHLYILRRMPEHKTMACLVSNRPLETVNKITSRKNVPEVITFRYSNPNEETTEPNQKDIPKKASEFDKVYLPDAGDATKNIKILIVKLLDMFDDLSSPTEQSSSNS